MLAMEALTRWATKHKEKTRAKLSEHKAILSESEASDYQMNIRLNHKKQNSEPKNSLFFLKIILN